MELQQSTPAVEEEHNISLKDSSKKLIRNPFTPLLLQENTQLILHKQYNRENFFKYNLYLELVLHNIEQTYSQISNQAKKSDIKIVDR